MTLDLAASISGVPLSRGCIVLRWLKALEAQRDCFPPDLADRAQQQRLASDVVERFGRLDVLVNCAGSRCVHGHVLVVDGGWMAR